jgi:hypothetical protein
MKLKKRIPDVRLDTRKIPKVFYQFSRRCHRVVVVKDDTTGHDICVYRVWGRNRWNYYAERVWLVNLNRSVVIK